MKTSPKKNPSKPNPAKAPTDKSRYCLTDCKDKKCVGKCDLEAGHTGTHHCYACDKWWTD